MRLGQHVLSGEPLLMQLCPCRVPSADEAPAPTTHCIVPATSASDKAPAATTRCEGLASSTDLLSAEVSTPFPPLLAVP